MELNLAIIVLTLRIMQSRDQWGLFDLKKPLYDAFRSEACGSKGECEGCSVPDCAFAADFGQELSSDPAVIKRHQKPSLPFVLHPPLLPQRAPAGTRVELKLVLVGNAVTRIDLYLRALRRLLAEGPVRGAVEKVVFADAAGGKSCEPVIVPAADFLAQPLPEGPLLLRVKAPLRLVHDGMPVREFSFPLFMRTLLRRVSSLAGYYGAGELDVDFRMLSQQADEVLVSRPSFSVERWKGSSRMEGLTGSCLIRGVIADLYPFLRLGELLNVGKGAPFGFGSFTLAPGE